MSKTKWYGCLGFLSLLGLVGVLTPQREFLSFFAFAVDFEYFFLPSDEMVEQYMNRSAARGFVAGMLVMAAVTVGSLLIGQQSGPALLTGCAAGWWGCAERPSATWKRGATIRRWCWRGTSRRCSG